MNAETPAHLLDDPVTPAARMFVRNNGIPPVTDNVEPLGWVLEITGEACLRPTRLTLGEIKQRFGHQTLQLQIECGGSGRAEFHPPAKGNQWTTGAVACPTWTGVRLKDVLDQCGLADNAVYVGYESADTHLSGDLGKQPISCGIPIHKAMEPETLIVWAMNGDPLPPLHGYPLRLVAGGWPGSVSGKWLTRLLIRDRVHDGAKMGGQSYRIPCDPVAPGTVVAENNENDETRMCIIESMPVKSFVTHPASGARVSGDAAIQVRGHAWAGDRRVASVFTSADYGTTWQRSELAAPVNRLAWQHWSTEISFARPGYYEVWARAVDDLGRSQPMVLPAWNPRGYLNNACHRIALAVALLPVVALAAEVDTDTGLIKRPGWEQVRSHCAGCHSFSLITNRRGDRQTWLDMIRWMQATQNLPTIPAATEAEILDYLAQAYSPPVTAQRRAPIRANLMPR